MPVALRVLADLLGEVDRLWLGLVLGLGLGLGLENLADLLSEVEPQRGDARQVVPVQAVPASHLLQTLHREAADPARS